VAPWGEFWNYEISAGTGVLRAGDHCRGVRGVQEDCRSKMGVIGKEEVGKIAVGRVENSPHGGGASGASLGRVWGEFGARLCQ